MKKAISHGLTVTIIFQLKMTKISHLNLEFEIQTFSKFQRTRDNEIWKNNFSY